MKEFFPYLLTFIFAIAIFVPPILKNLERQYRKTKGEKYEKHVAGEFILNDYNVILHGIEMGKKDMGIDLIAKKEGEVCLIQCKNWKRDSKYKITHHTLKEFIGNTVLFLEKFPEHKHENIRRIFITSNNILDKSAEYLLKQNNNVIEYQVIPEKLF